MTKSTMDQLLDLAASDINHPERHLHVERYIYSGRGLEGWNLKEGETVYEVSITLWKASGDGRETIVGYGHSFEDACSGAMGRIKPWVEERLKGARTQLGYAQRSVDDLENLLARVPS